MRMGNREIVMLCVCVGLAIASVSVLRLCLVVLGTPRTVWLEEYPRLADANRVVGATTAGFAQSLVDAVNDPILVSARMGECMSGLEESGSRTSTPASCIAVIDAGLRGNPASGELWAYKSDVIAGAGDFGTSMQAALRQAYRTAPREGWIAAGRVILGARLYPLLSGDLQDDVVGDLHLVLADKDLSQPLVERYATDPALRDAGRPAMRRLSATEVEGFIARVRRYLGLG